ncbi:MAG: redoxin domain-containing protein [Thermomicrobiales bacterium]
MSDPPVRHGPPAPPGIADNQPEGANPVAPDVDPSPRSDAVITYRPAQARRDPQPSPTTAGPRSEARTNVARSSPGPPREPTPASATSPAASPTARAEFPLDLNRLGVIGLVVALALAAIWLDRGQHDPVAGLGIVPQPGVSEPPPPLTSLAAGDPAPNFRLRTSDGDIVELADLRGQPVLIHFWTTWCLVCTGEFSSFQEAATAHAGNLSIVGVNVGESAGRVNAAADANGAGYLMLLDRDLEVSRHYGVEDYPATILIDATGAIASIDLGALSAADLKSRLDAVLDN